MGKDRKGRKKPGGEAWGRAVGDMSRGARPGGAGEQSSSSQASGIGVRRLPVLGGLAVTAATSIPNSYANGQDNSAKGLFG